MTLRNAVIAFFVILAAVVVTKTGRGSTPAPRQASATRKPAAVTCSISPQRVAVAGGKLVSGALYRCDSPGPQKLTLTVRLQQSTGGNWRTLAQQQITAAGGQTLDTVAAAQRTPQVSAPCVAGVYRTEAEWSLNGSGPKTKLSAERRNPC